MIGLGLSDDKAKSISTGPQYITLDNEIKCLSLACFLATPPIKLQLELLIANHLDQLL
jgi:hypothetical protein